MLGDIMHMTIRTHIIATLVTMGLFSLFFGCSKRDAVQPATQKFTELSPDDITRLEQQRGVVAGAAKQRYGTVSLTKTKADLAVLQRLIDDQAFSKTQAHELQCLGIVFGDVLAAELPLRWMIVTDEYGTDPTLRYKDTTVQINALTMLSKRVERGENINVHVMLQSTKEQIAKIEKELQK
jgi:hypothetical protein